MSLLGPVHTTPVGGDGSQFFSDRGMRSDGYRVYPSDDGRRAGENWPRPFGLLRKSGHTSFSPSTVDPPQPSGSASYGRIFAGSATRRGSVNRPLEEKGARASSLVLILAGAEHQGFDRFVGILAFVEDQLHLLGNGHFDAVLA